MSISCGHSLESSESSNEEENPWNGDDVYRNGGINPHKKRRIQRNSKEKAALGIFGSDSDDDGPGKRWKKKSHLRRKGVDFVSNRKQSVGNEENNETFITEKDESQLSPMVQGPSQFSDLDNLPISKSTDSNFQSIATDLGSRILATPHVNSYSTKIRPRQSLSPDYRNNQKILSGTSKNTTGSFAARMMAKMGYKHGQGLGKEGQGRNSVIEVTLRPHGAGLGAVREKSDQEIKEEKRQAGLTGNGFETPEYWKNYRIDSRKRTQSDRNENIMSKHKSTHKFEFRTLAEVKNLAPGLHVPESFLSILDMTVPGQRTLNSTAGILNQDIKPKSEEHIEILKLTQSAENDLSAYVEEWKYLEERKVYNKSILTKIRHNIVEEEKRLDVMRLFVNKIQSTYQPAKEMTGCDQIFKALEKMAIMDEPEVSGRSKELSKIAVAIVHPFLRQAVQNWSPLEDPDLGGLVTRLSNNRKILGVVTSDDVLMTSRSSLNATHIKQITHYESMIYQIVYPKILNSIEQKWDVYDPAALQALLKTWKDLLPSFIRSRILNQAVVRKLNLAVVSWNPRRKKTNQLPHLWLFPWLQHLSAHHTDPKSTNGLVSDIKRKFRQLLDSWDFHKGVIPGLHQWREVLCNGPTNDHWTPLIMNHVLPNMSKFLKNEHNFMVNPNDQAPFMSSLQGILEWQSVIKTRVVAQVIVDTVFPLWHNALYQWLTVVGPNEEIGQWFEWWRNDVFPDEVKNTELIKNEFEKGHEMIKLALDLGVRVTELLPAPKLQNQTSSNQPKPTPISISDRLEENSLRHEIEDWCIENDLQFLPEKGIFHSTGPLHRITAAGNGKNGALVCIKGEQIIALSKKGQEYAEINIKWESTNARDLLLGLAWNNVK